MASTQKRTSPIKFAHLAEKSEKGSISNLSAKAAAAAAAPFAANAEEAVRGVPGVNFGVDGNSKSRYTHKAGVPGYENINDNTESAMLAIAKKSNPKAPENQTGPAEPAVAGARQSK